MCDSSCPELFLKSCLTNIVMKFNKVSKSTTIIVLTGLVLFSSNLSIIPASLTTMQLTLTGNVTGVLTEAEIKQVLPTVTGYGGYEKSTGIIITGSIWKGIHIPLFLSSILGDLDYNLSVIAADLYSRNFTRDEVEGGLRGFDEDNNTLSIKVIPVLAYEENNTALSDDDGPLRIVFIGENNQSILTISKYWVRQVDTLRVSLNTGEAITLTSNSIPDSTTSNASFSVSILMLVLTSTLIVVIRRKKILK
ncbi:hypothetical protein CEE45_12125 [Candidatus Heimdallarchaeota archaeon B3_Heim]|nr:MAG: hypothetical protein CEE45_12125 [Candidatus Heimdallarchaeota archaeon B3_Heim]